MTKEQLKNLLKQNQVLADINYKEIGKDENGFPTYEIEYVAAPTNYKLVRIFENLEVAVLEDLDYQVVQDEPTNEA